MSKTYIAALASLVASIGFLSEAEAITFFNAVVVVVTTVATLWGRYDAGGVNIFGIKDR